MYCPKQDFRGLVDPAPAETLDRALATDQFRITVQR